MESFFFTHVSVFLRYQRFTKIHQTILRKIAPQKSIGGNPCVLGLSVGQPIPRIFIYPLHITINPFLFRSKIEKVIYVDDPDEE